MTGLRADACIAGVGQTTFTKASDRPAAVLGVEAIRRAAQDAGIPVTAIDGVVPYPMGPSAEEMMAVLGLSEVTFTASARMGGASSVAALGLAAQAVRLGLASYVVTFVARNAGTRTPISERVRELAGQELRLGLEHPHGLSTPAQWYALMCRRHMIEFGTTREALGTVSTTMRRHAQLNPAAQMHGREMTMEQYLASPMIADPYQLFDCCLETDGASAVIVTSAERAADLRTRPVAVRSVAQAHPFPADDISSRADIFRTGLTTAAPRAFAAAEVTPQDIDLALIYDCFTFEVIQQLEEAGFCERGSGGDFVLSGAIDRSGRLPVNPHGGLLSEGHLAGMNHVVEAVTQLRGAAGQRQIDDARLAVVTGWGDMGDGSIAVLEAGRRTS